MIFGYNVTDWNGEDIEIPDQEPPKPEEEEIEIPEVYLQPPPLLNYTDPVVRHDKYIEYGVAVQYDPQYSMVDPGKKSNYQEDFDQERTYGKVIPIVQVDNSVINSDCVQEVEILYEGFLPRLNLVVIDVDGRLKSQNLPKKGSQIKVIIVPQQEGAYKKLSLKFGVDNPPEFDGNLIIYKDCEAYYPELTEGAPKSYKHDGCDDERCKTGETITPNFYEYMHDVAIHLGLGYQTTSQVKEIQDRMPRNSRNFTVKEFIKEQLQISGLDKNSLFDAWIDLYGYLTVVNVPWVLSQEIDHTYLSLKALKGTNSTTEYMPRPEYEEVNRTITNYHAQHGRSNMSYVDYVHIIDEAAIARMGTVVNIFVFNGIANAAQGALGNVLNQVNMQATASTYEEEQTRDQWQTQTRTLVFTENNECPTTTQKELRKRFFTEIRARIFAIELEEYNLGLQRGTLVNIADFTYDSRKKQKIIEETSAIVEQREDYEDIENNSMDGIKPVDEIMDDSIGKLDPDIAGLYYIDSMKFAYSKDQQRIVQILYLIRKNPPTPISNAVSAQAFDPEKGGGGEGGDNPTSEPASINEANERQENEAAATENSETPSFEHTVLDSNSDGVMPVDQIITAFKFI